MIGGRFEAEQGSDENNYNVSLFYIDAKSGAIANSVDYTKMPIQTPSYDPVGDVIVGLTWDGKEADGNMTYAVVYADPVTLEPVKVFSPLKEWCTYSDIWS